MGDLYLVAGHGDGDPGATSAGRKEDAETRKFCLAVQREMANRGKKVKIYGDSDNLSYNMYKQTAKGYGAHNNADTSNDVVEVHFNAYNGSAKGSEALIKGNATTLDNNIVKVFGKYFTDRGIKKRTDLLNLSTYASRGISYRLLEICFIDNSSDMKIYDDNFDNIVSDFCDLFASGTVEQPSTPSTPLTVSYTQAYDANKTKTWKSVTYWGDSSPIKVPTSNISNNKLTKDWNGWLKGTQFRNVTSTPSTTYTPTKYYLGGWNDIKAKYGSTDTFKSSIMKEETNTSKYGSGVYTFKSSASAGDRKGWDSNQRFKK